MNRVMQEAIRGFEMYYPELTSKVTKYYEDRLGYLVVELVDGGTLLYDDYNQTCRDTSSLDNKQEFSRRLRLLMNRKHISQRELADRSGTTETSVSYYVNGKRKPSYQIVSSFADVLGCSTDDFRYIDPRRK